MAIDEGWLDLMPLTLYAYPRSSNNRFGEPGFSTMPRHADGVRCRIEPNMRRIVSGEGREFVPSVRIIVDAIDIAVGDKITVAGQTYDIDAIEDQYDETGLHHQELLCT